MKIKKILWICIALAVFVLASCAEMLTALGIKQEEQAVLRASKTSLSAIAGEEGQEITLSSDLPINFESCVWTNSNPAAAELTAAGSSAILKPLAEGTGVITISHSDTQPVSIVYSIGAVSEGRGAEGSDKPVYLGPQSETSYVVSVGDTVNMEASLINGGASAELDIQWQTEEDSPVRLIGSTGTSIAVEAMSPGMAAITASHADSSNSLRYTVLVRENAGSQSGSETDHSFDKEKYLEARATSYIVEVGENLNLSAALINGENYEQQGIQWSGAGDEINLVGNSGAAVAVEALSAGMAAVTVSHPESVNTVSIYISIKEPSSQNGSGIGQSTEEKYLEARATSYIVEVGDILNLSAALINGENYEQQGIQWSGSENEINLVGNSGAAVAVEALSAGMAVVTVSHPESVNTVSISISIKEPSAQSGSGNDQSSDEKYLEARATSYIVEVGDILNLSAALINGENYEQQGIQWSGSENEITLVGNSGAAVAVEALSAGMAVVTVSHPESINTVSISISIKEPSAQSGSGIGQNSEEKYLEARATSYIVEVGDILNLSAALINGENYEQQGIQWSGSENEINLVGNSGAAIVVEALSAGMAVVTVSHPESINTISISISIKEPSAQSGSGNDQSTDEKYLEARATSYIVEVGDILNLSAALINGENYEQQGIQWSSSGNQINLIGKSGAAIVVEAVYPGMAELSVSHPESVNTFSIYIYIKDPASQAEPEQEKYLESRKSNYSADIGDSLTLTATLVNGTPLDEQSITWATANPDIVQLRGNTGADIAIQALTSGTAVIKAAHPESLNVLTIFLFVTEAVDKYIIPEQNALVMTVGERTTVRVSYYGGTALEQLAIAWTSGNESVARLVGETGTSIQVIAVAEGSTVIRPSHPASLNNPPITILVMPNEAPPETLKYLILPEQSVSMEIGEQKSLKARFIGASDLEEQNIQWFTDGTDVLELLGKSGTRVLSEAKMTGTSIVTVSHPNSTNTVSMTVRIRDRERTLKLSRNDLSLKTSDSPETISLSISGGIEADYEDLQWTSGNDAVAIVHGKGKSVSIDPVGVGVTEITVTLLTTGQKASMLATVLPERYVDFPAQQIRLERFDTDNVELLYSPSNLAISLMASDVEGITVIRDEANPGIIHITANTEGAYTLTAIAPGGYRDILNVISYVLREINVSERSFNMLPFETVESSIEIIPAEEIFSPDITLDIDYPDIADIRLSGEQLKISTKKEGVATVSIKDMRKDRSLAIPIEVVVEYDDISELVDDGDNISLSESRGPNRKHLGSKTVVVEIDPSVRVHSFSWNAQEGWLARGNRGSGIYLSQIDDKSRSIVVDVYGDDGLNIADDVNAFYGNFSYTIKHGAKGSKTYTKTIQVRGDAY